MSETKSCGSAAIRVERVTDEVFAVGMDERPLVSASQLSNPDFLATRS